MKCFTYRILALIVLTGMAVPLRVPGRQPRFPKTTAGASPAVQAGPNKDEKADQDKAKEGLPLRAERKLEFTTDEGTWISVDVSPDGKTLVFDLIGNLYTLSIDGGEARRITDGSLAFNRQPRFSPDGHRIAFVSDRDGSDNLWISNPDGSEPKKLTSEKSGGFSSPSWTPDGQYVIATKLVDMIGFQKETWMYHIKGGSGVPVGKGGAAPREVPGLPEAELGPVASPDGHYLYFAKSTRSAFAEGARFPFWQVARRDRATGDEDLITNARGSGMRPELSPDGTKLVYATRHDTATGLRILDFRTGDDRWLKYPVQRDDQDGFTKSDLLPGYAFTPDGKDVVVSYGGKIHRVDILTANDRIIPFTAHVSQDLGPRLEFPRRVDDDQTLRTRLVQEPVQSPDGRRLAFSALTHLYIMDLPNGQARRVTSVSAREFQPAWSPDGKWLTYVTWTAEEGGAIWKTGVDGEGEPQRLTVAPAFYMKPVWTPDGSRVVALRAARQEGLENPMAVVLSPKLFDLIWLPSGGGDVTLIAPSRGSGRPHFSGSDGRVYVHSGLTLTSMRFDGTDRQTLLKLTGKSDSAGDPSPQDIELSPDGKFALVLYRTQLYLVTVPRVGGDPPPINLEAGSVPLKRVTDVGADSFAWADSGSTITWSLGARFFRQKLSTIDFESDKGDKSKAASSSSAAGTATQTNAQDTGAPANPAVEEITISIEAPRYRPTGVVVLRGAQVITMKGDEVIPNADIVVSGNRITAVDRRGAVDIPAGAKIVDVKGATIMPGIVDVHNHWNGRMFGGIIGMQNWDFLANLAWGITAGRDPQTQTNDIFAYQDLVETNEILGPRAFSTGPGIFWTTDFQSADEAYKRVSKYTEFYRTQLIKSYMVGNRRQREWVVQACKRLNVMPTTEGGGDLMLDLTHAIDGFSGNEHSLPVVPIYKDVVELFAQSGTAYTPTFVVAYGGPMGENFYFEHYDIHDDPKIRRFLPHYVVDSKARRRAWYRDDEYHFKDIAAGANRIIAAGGRVCIGGHGELSGLGTHWEMWALASGGIKNIEVLRSATLRGAEAIGYSQDLGSIEAGKLADLIVLTRDPLQDIHNTTSIRYVMKNGQLFDGNTLDEVWPKEKPLAPLWFWSEGLK